MWQELSRKLELDANNYGIIEQRGIKHADIVNEAKNDDFLSKYWDARVFGNTILQEAEKTPIQTGVAQFGLGVSVSPIFIERMTTTNITPVQNDKSRGMAPLAYRVVQHAVYCMPFFINATIATKTRCSEKDIRLLRRLIPYAYVHTASYLRPQVNIRHAFYIEHNSAIGRFNDFEVIEKLTPKRIDHAGTPSMSWADYDVKGLQEQWEQVRQCLKASQKALNAWDLVQEMSNDQI